MRIEARNFFLSCLILMLAGVAAPALAHKGDFRRFCEQLLSAPKESSTIPFEISVARFKDGTEISIVESNFDSGPRKVFASFEFEVAGQGKQTLTIRELKTQSRRFNTDFGRLLFARALDLYPNVVEIQDELIERDMVTFVDALSMNFTTEEAILLTDAYKRLAALGFGQVSYVRMGLEDNDAFGALLVHFGVERN